MDDNTAINNAIPSTIQSEYGIAAAIEAKRLSEKYGKDFFEYDDLLNIIPVGKNNIRNLMRRNDFPVIEIGNRKVISVIALAFWMTKNADKLIDN